MFSLWINRYGTVYAYRPNWETWAIYENDYKPVKDHL